MLISGREFSAHHLLLGAEVQRLSMEEVEIFWQYGCRKILPDIDNKEEDKMGSGVWPH